MNQERFCLLGSDSEDTCWTAPQKVDRGMSLLKNLKNLTGSFK